MNCQTAVVDNSSLHNRGFQTESQTKLEVFNGLMGIRKMESSVVTTFLDAQTLSGPGPPSRKPLRDPVQKTFPAIVSRLPGH